MKEETTWKIGALVLLFIVLIQMYAVMELRKNNEIDLQDAYLQGQYDLSYDINNMWVRDLVQFGLTYQNIVYENETYTMECKLP